MKNDQFRRDLTDLLNRHSIESGSNTPDHILADFVIGCLRAYEHAVTSRDALFDSPDDDTKEI